MLFLSRFVYEKKSLHGRSQGFLPSWTQHYMQVDDTHESTGGTRVSSNMGRVTSILSNREEGTLVSSIRSNGYPSFIHQGWGYPYFIQWEIGVTNWVWGTPVLHMKGHDTPVSSNGVGAPCFIQEWEYTLFHPTGYGYHCFLPTCAATQNAEKFYGTTQVLLSVYRTTGPIRYTLFKPVD